MSSSAVVDAFMNYVLRHTLDKTKAAVLNQIMEIAAHLDPDYVRYLIMSPERTQRFVLQQERDVLGLDSDIAPDHIVATADHAFNLCSRFVSGGGQPFAPRWIHPTVRAFAAFLLDDRPPSAGNSPPKLHRPPKMFAFVDALRKCCPAQIVPLISASCPHKLVATVLDSDEDLGDDLDAAERL